MALARSRYAARGLSGSDDDIVDERRIVAGRRRRRELDRMASGRRREAVGRIRREGAGSRREGSDRRVVEQDVERLDSPEACALRRLEAQFIRARGKRQTLAELSGYAAVRLQVGRLQSFRGIVGSAEDAAVALDARPGIKRPSGGRQADDRIGFLERDDNFTDRARERTSRKSILDFAFKNDYDAHMSRPREFDVDRALCQAMEVFWAKGFKSTSYEDLTRTTKVKKQSLYGVFKDKRDLFLKALALYREQSVELLNELASREAHPIRKLEAICEAALFPNEEAMRRGCLMVNSVLEFGAEDPEVNREADLMSGHVHRLLEEVIRSGQDQRLITNRLTSQELASFLNNAISGAKIMEKSGASKEHIDAVMRTTIALMAPEKT